MNINRKLLVFILLLTTTYSVFSQRIIDRNKNGEKFREVYYDSGDKTIQKFKSDTNYSNVISYWSNGNIRESYSLCNPGNSISKYDGTFIKYYSSGIVNTIEYYDCGVVTGVWYEYFESGKIKAQKSFIYDSSYSSNYLMEYDITIGDPNIGSSSSSKFAGLPNGKWIEWYENGKIANEKSFSHGLEIGNWIWYYENGNKRKEGSYYTESTLKYPEKVKMVVSPDEIEDKIAVGFFPHVRPKHGKWIEWSKDGKLKTEKHYYKGKLEKEIKF